MVGGPGLSVDDIKGTESEEDRGKQDSGQKAATSVFAEALSQTSPSTNKHGLHNGSGNGSKSSRTKRTSK
jgi:Mn-containing catalase